MLYKTFYNSPIGNIILCSNGKDLTHLYFDYQSTISIDGLENPRLEVFKLTKNWLARYFNGEKPSICEISFMPEGSNFRKMVWDILLQIPYGKTTTYGEIAKEISIKTGKKMSAQAVGNAIGHNPILIIIPCHRVIGKDGDLTGFAAGLGIKKKLLELEEINNNSQICHALK